MSEGKGDKGLSLRTNRKARAPTIAKQISGPFLRAGDGLRSAGGKAPFGSSQRPQGGGKVSFDSMFYNFVTNRHDRRLILSNDDILLDSTIYRLISTRPCLLSHLYPLSRANMLRPEIKDAALYLRKVLAYPSILKH